MVDAGSERVRPKETCFDDKVSGVVLGDSSGICDTGRLEVSLSLEVEEEKLPVVGGVTSIAAGCSKNDEEE